MSLSLKSIVLWFSILLLAIGNGVFRETILIPATGRTAGLLASGAILSACIWVVAWFGVAWCGPGSSRRWLRIGGLWVILTVVFEFSFGHFVEHKTWAELLGAYAFRDGNVWPLVLVFTFLAPTLAAKTRKLVRLEPSSEATR